MMRFFNLSIYTLSLLFLISCGNSSNKQLTAEEQMALASKKANAYFDVCFDAAVDRSPIYQSYLAIKKDYGKWDDLSPKHEQEELEIAKAELKYALDSIQPELLDKETKISYELFVTDRQHAIEDYKWRNYDYPINQMFGWHSRIPSFLINIHTIADSSDAAAYIARLQRVGPFMNQIIDQLKRHEAAGIVPPKFVFPRVIEDSQNLLKGAPFDSGEPSTLLADFTSKIEKLDLGPQLKYTMIKDAKSALLTSFKPAYETLIAFLTEQEKRATTDDGCWKFPEGEAYYITRLNRITTTHMTPEEIHELGLKEVDRIHNEMRGIMKEVGFKGDLQQFFTFLKEDPQFYYPNTEAGKEAYLAKATQVIDDMRARLDELFITKPKADIEVKRVEAFRENSAGKAFYNSPAPDGSRPRYFYVNLASTKNQPKFEMEALAYHEGIPGHHMDRNIAQEINNVAKFRKYSGYTAFVEGWGLYSEFIPKEMGFYADSYSDYGRLSLELWRACRLVVDTGIHFKKWTREQGISYYTQNTSGSDRECERMVERHIVMPAQATAYKIGMLKILDLRKKAMEELGDQFDIREFHEVVLTSGAIPLDVLEQLVNQYIASKKA